MVNKIAQEHIERMYDEAEKDVVTLFGKCAILACRLKNGFVLVASSACVDPDNFDINVALNICEKRIKERLWELEGYLLQNHLFQ